MSRPGIRNEDSVVNLVKPTLYSIYDKDVVASATDYSALHKVTSAQGVQEPPSKPKSTYERVIGLVWAFIVLGVFGNVFAALSSELYDNLQLKKGMLSVTLDSIAQYIQDRTSANLDKCVVFGVLGILCGCVIPLCDHVLFASRQYQLHTSNDFQAILKCLNSLLGISLGIRHLGWKSSLQASGAWGLLNVILWLYFDGTRTILLVGSLISVVSCAIAVATVTTTDTSLLLYIMDFYFFSLLIFGKIGRYLFRNW